MEDKEAFDKYVWTIGDGIFRHDRNFGAKLDKWKFMLVEQPKIPFANETLIPKITFTYNFVTEEYARQALSDVYSMILGKAYDFKENDIGRYLICYYDE